ncbi:Uncharacterised protein [Alloiococcus otitis]|uniref:Barstar (barnase inhibitor) domain-containing protein n=1 Tax=Alloiococcus otitis ATCC 51267 TaxID=883081 RepID=K9EA40_9LACT|nr:hypothetical protein HMPREF9698_00401 [Alloiococcus otitis ATCC 51267]SUU80997.1 Uncharacterised protein [Alloiococcus otitis]
MDIVTIHCRDLIQAGQDLNYLKDRLDLTNCSGNNLDALWDCLSEKEDDCLVILRQSRLLKESSRGLKLQRFFQSLDQNLTCYKIIYK